MAATITQNYLVTTTNGSLNVCATIPIDNNTLYWFECKIIGRESSGGTYAYYVREAYCYRNGGGIATISAVQAPITIETDASYDATLGVDGGNNFRCLVQGKLAATVNWSATIRYGKVS